MNWNRGGTNKTAGPYKLLPGTFKLSSAWVRGIARFIRRKINRLLTETQRETYNRFCAQSPLSSEILRRPLQITSPWLSVLASSMLQHTSSTAGVLAGVYSDQWHSRYFRGRGFLFPPAEFEAGQQCSVFDEGKFASAICRVAMSANSMIFFSGNQKAVCK